MMRLYCWLFGHKWRTGVIDRPYGTNYNTIGCKRCGKPLGKYGRVI